MKSEHKLLYVIITDQQQTINEIRKKKTVQNARVTWEKYENKKVISQCHRCQMWGTPPLTVTAIPNVQAHTKPEHAPSQKIYQQDV